MHWPAFTRTKGRTWGTNTRGSLRTRSLKDRLSWDGAAWRWTNTSRSAGLCRWRWRDRTWRRLVHRTRSCLGNDHARRRILRRRLCRWRRWTRSARSNWRRGRRGGRDRRCRWWRRRNHCGRRSWRRGRTNWRRGCGRSCWNWRRRCWCSRLLDGRRDNRWPRGCRRRRSNRCRRCWRHRLRRRRHNCRPRSGRRRCGFHRRRRRRRSRSFLLLRDRPQHIARTGDVGQINFGLDFFFTARQTRGARRGTLRFSRAADIGPH